MTAKKSWETPKLEVFGLLREMTQDAGGKGEPPKFAGVHDNIPQGEDLLIQCPPGQFNMDGTCNGIGAVS
jgi:hypothetical protein